MRHLALFPLIALASPLDAQKEGAAAPPIAAIDVARIRELHRLSEQLGDRIWPGFDTRRIPIAVNGDDRQEMLIGHPHPPAEYHPFGAHRLAGNPVLIRDGITRYGPGSGGWAIELGGESAAYVSTKPPGLPTEDYLSLILHECFHCYQKGYRQRADGARGELPGWDAEYSAYLCVESALLRTALDGASDPAQRELARMFVAVRRERRRGLDPALVLVEGEREYDEGTATYSQARLLELLAERGGAGPETSLEDASYHGFTGARQGYERMLASLRTSPGHPTTFFHAMYHHGMALGLLLDRLRPGWKEEMRARGATQFGLLEKALPLTPGEQATLLAAARKRFQYDQQLATQRRLIDGILDRVRGFVLAPGRRYRIHIDKVRGRFNWKPRGPVLKVPALVERELREHLQAAGVAVSGSLSSGRSVWAGGIHRFEKGGLIFESQAVPVIFGHRFMEWIDPDPATDRSDLSVEAGSRAGDLLREVRIATTGFTLTAPAARIEWSPGLVVIQVLPR